MRRSLALKSQLFFKDVSLRVQQLKVITSKILLRLHQPSLECIFLVLKFHKYYISFAFAQEYHYLGCKVTVTQCSSKHKFTGALFKAHSNTPETIHFKPFPSYSLSFLASVKFSSLPQWKVNCFDIVSPKLTNFPPSLLFSSSTREDTQKNRNVVMKSKNLLDIRALIYIHAFSEIS